MNGLFNYNATPMAPPGIKALVYEIPQQRKTWAQHGVDAWYIGYCQDHCRCHKTYVPATWGERIAHTVSFLLHDFLVPANNYQEDLDRYIHDLTTSLQHRYLYTPLQPVGDEKFAAIKALENIFCPDYPAQTNPAPIHPIVELPTATLPPQLSQQSTSVDFSPQSQEHLEFVFD